MLRRPWFVVVAYLALGCSSGALDEPQGGGGVSGAGGAPPVCDAPGYPTSAERESVGTVEATVLDLDGNTVPNLLVQVCGLDLCINGESDSAGYSVVSVGAGNEMKLPAFKYSDAKGLTHGKIAILIDAPIESLDLGELRVPALPAEGAPIAAGTTAISAGAELSVAAGASVTFDRIFYRTADEQAFRAAELPVDRAPANFGADFAAEIFYALGPLDTEFCPPAELVLPNSAGFEPGSEVEFFLHGLDINERYAPYGGFAQFADGLVSEDGAVVRTTSGGIPFLSLVAVRRKN